MNKIFYCSNTVQFIIVSIFFLFIFVFNVLLPTQEHDGICIYLQLTQITMNITKMQDIDIPIKFRITISYPIGCDELVPIIM